MSASNVAVENFFGPLASGITEEKKRTRRAENGL